MMISIQHVQFIECCICSSEMLIVWHVEQRKYYAACPRCRGLCEISDIGEQSQSTKERVQ